ncbi:MAG: hypothetical protein QXO86_06685 [Nitrososphaerota archaeon]
MIGSIEERKLWAICLLCVVFAVAASPPAEAFIFGKIIRILNFGPLVSVTK